MHHLQCSPAHVVMARASLAVGSCSALARIERKPWKPTLEWSKLETVKYRENVIIQHQEKQSRINFPNRF
jgi:hypothetical protein